MFTLEKNLWSRLLESNKKQIPLKSFCLEIRIDSLSIKSWRTKKKLNKLVTSILTRITDWKILCVYIIHVYRITKNWGPGPCNSLHHADNRRYFLSLSSANMKSKGSAHVLHDEGSGKIWTCYCWEKGNFIMINEFKYGQTWKIWPSPVYHFTMPLKGKKNHFLGCLVLRG